MPTPTLQLQLGLLRRLTHDTPVSELRRFLQVNEQWGGHIWAIPGGASWAQFPGNWADGKGKNAGKDASLSLCILFSEGVPFKLIFFFCLLGELTTKHKLFAETDGHSPACFTLRQKSILLNVYDSFKKSEAYFSSRHYGWTTFKTNQQRNIAGVSVWHANKLFLEFLRRLRISLEYLRSLEVILKTCLKSIIHRPVSTNKMPRREGI